MWSNNNGDNFSDDSLFHKIRDRIKILDNHLDSSNYSKQKCQLKTELNNFLQKINTSKNLLNASPEDIRSFLIYKEENGRTQLHKNDCAFKNKVGLHKCG